MTTQADQSCHRRVRGLSPFSAAIVGALLAVNAGSAQSRALSSIVVDITSLVWYVDDGDGTPDQDDLPIGAYTIGDAVPTGQLQLDRIINQFSSRDGAFVEAGVQSDRTDDFAQRAVAPSPLWNDYDVPIAASADCSSTSTTVCAGNTAGTSLAELSLTNAALGFAYFSNGTEVAPAGGQIRSSAYADIPSVDAGTGDTATPGDASSSFASSAAFIYRGASALSTYFALTYSLSFVADLDNETGVDEPPRAYVQSSFRIRSDGNSTFDWRPSELNGCYLMGANPPEPCSTNTLTATTNQTIYSTDFRVNRDPNNPLFQGSAVSLELALVASSLSSTPAPATIALFGFGLVAWVALFRRRRAQA